MRRILPLLLLALLLLPALSLRAQAPPDPAAGPDSARVTQVDSTHYPDVTLYVSVSGANGQPVGGLTARDFTVTEDGLPVSISRFAGGGAGSITAMLVIDRSGSMSENGKMEGAKDAARAFIRQMRAGDRTAVIAFSSQSELIQPFSSDVSQLDRAIRRIRSNGSTALYDSLVAGVEDLNGLSGRRALLLLTDGRDIVSVDNPVPASRASLDEAIQEATQAGISVQVIGLGDRDSSDPRGGIDEPVLRRIAQETGGEYFYAPSGDELAGLYRKLSADLQQEYALTYRSPRPFYDGTRRDISVRVSGMPAATGGYIERHLIDVRSDPLVGLLLLLPILGALLLPSLIWRRTTNDQRSAEDRGWKIEDSPPPSSIFHPPSSVTDGSTIMQAGAVVVIPPDVARCTACDAPLLRAGARFCSECGQPQPAPPHAPVRRIFCDQCGRPLRDGAHFCAHCGATVPVPSILQT